MHFPHHVFAEAHGQHPEVIGANDTPPMLDPRERERMQLAVVHIVPQHRSFRERCPQMVAHAQEHEVLLLHGLQQVLIDPKGEITHPEVDLVEKAIIIDEGRKVEVARNPGQEMFKNL